MTAQDLFRQGELAAAIDTLNQQLKARPQDAEGRTFLFELLCFAGNLDRAAQQLDVVASQSADSEWAVQVYRNILAAERKRNRLLSDGLAPEFLLEPPPFARRQLDALSRLREGNAEEAHEIFQAVEQMRPALSGTVDGKAFDDFRDCDDLVAPVFELIVLADYLWIPISQVQELEIGAPERPRDLVWLPVRLVLEDGSAKRGYMPTRYVGSAGHEDELISLGRKTDWLEDSSGTVRGVGQRLFLAGNEAAPIVDVRKIQFALPDT